MLDISIPAKLQEPFYKVHAISCDANSWAMDGLEEDTELVRALCIYAKKKPSRIAADLGMAATTLTRPASAKADTRIGRVTLDKLKAAYPDFPPFKTGAPPTSNAQTIAFEGASQNDARPNLPVYGTALGSSKTVEGEAIEQTTLNKSEVLEYVKRPTLLNRRAESYGLYIQGGSMHPALPDGEMVAVVPNMALSVGDNVVVYLRPENPEDDDGQTARAVLVKELVKRNSAQVTLRQYAPFAEFTIDMDTVIRIDRVLTRREMLS